MGGGSQTKQGAPLSVQRHWPGHGDSAAASLTADELDQLASDSAVLVGSSIGGDVAARIAVRRPALVDELHFRAGKNGATRPGSVDCCAVRATPASMRRSTKAGLALRSISPVRRAV